MPTVQSRPVEGKANAKAGMKPTAKNAQLKRPAGPPRDSVELAAPAKESDNLFKGTKRDKDHANTSHSSVILA